MVKENYLIAHHMWCCSPVVGKGTCEAEVLSSNPSKVRKNRTRTYSRKKSPKRGGKKKIFFWFLFSLQIFILARKRMMAVTYVLT